MGKHLRYIVAISLIIAILAPVFNVFYLYPKLKDSMLATITEEALEVASHLRNMTFPNNRFKINDDIKAELFVAKRDFNLEKIKIFSSTGAVVFSTSDEEIGSTIAAEYFQARVSKGEIVTHIVNKREESMEGAPVMADVVETYVPVMNGKEFTGAFEIYFDITSNLASINTIIKTSSVLVLAAMGIFFLIVLLLSIRMNNALAMLVAAEKEADHANRAKSDFLARMSHEIRTPMNAIIGLSDMLLAETLTATQREDVGMLKFSANHLLAIINDILDLSKIDAGKMKLKPERFPLRLIIDSTIRSLAVLAEEKGIALESDLSQDLPDVVVGDQVRLTQILNNLLSNAIKFTDRGSVRLSVAQATIKQDAVCIRFTVHDTGIGIPEAHINSIFDAFTQADTSYTRRFGGTGLGLAITSRLIEAMGGSLDVTSREGIGSTFGFTLCFALPFAHEEYIAGPVELHGVTDYTPPAGEGRHGILLVEDNPINQKVATRILEAAGCEVTVANDGREALKLYGQREFDLVLMDIEMPNMNGYDATKAIRALEGKSRHTPIIAMTAHVFERDCDGCILAGMDNYISKPVNAKDLINLINKTIRAGR